MVVADRLAASGDRVTVYEADNRLGGHVHSVDVDCDGERTTIDMGFIVFNEATYPLFCALLEELEIASQPADMGFSVRSDRDGLEYGSHSLRALFAQPGNALRPRFWRMLRSIRRFNRESEALLAEGDEKVSLASYLAGAGYPEEFAEHYLIPLGSSIWSCTPRRILDFPAVEFVRFLSNHGLLELRPEKRWRTIPGGAASYVDALARRAPAEFRTGCAVDRVEPGAQSVWVSSARGDEAYDRVVLATHADDSLRLLHQPNSAERAILGAVPYETNEAWLHRDPSLLPRHRAAWKSWNYFVPADTDGRLSITYDMNRLQSVAQPAPLLVTLNPPSGIAPRDVIERVSFRHPVYNERGFAAQRQHAAIDGVRGIHYCGAYWGYGFHEDGVRSAARVVERLHPQRVASR